MKNYFLLLIVSLMLIACSDSDPIIHESSENSESSIPLYECEPSTACFTSEEIKLWFSGNELKPEQEFYIYIQALNPDVEILGGKIEGTVMEMGYIPLFFEPLSNEVTVAKGMVGVCDTDNMRWQVSITYKGKRIPEKAVNIEIPMRYW